MLFRSSIGLLLTAVSLRAAEPEQPAYTTRTLQGKVVWLAEAMQRLHGVQTVAEAAENSLALETGAGELFPLVEDVRGRAFRRDERLRKMPVELLVRQQRGSPVVQIVRVFELQGSEKSEVDYWCDICAIAMFELQACECCQGPIELRKRPVKAEQP